VRLHNMEAIDVSGNRSRTQVSFTMSEDHAVR
jgi:hypothetical protein